MHTYISCFSLIVFLSAPASKGRKQISFQSDGVITHQYRDCNFSRGKSIRETSENRRHLENKMMKKVSCKVNGIATIYPDSASRASSENFIAYMKSNNEERERVQVTNYSLEEQFDYCTLNIVCAKSSSN